MSVEASTAGRATPEYTDGYARIVEVVRWLLVAVLVVDCVIGLIVRPHPSTLADLRHDLATGSARSVSFDDSGALPAASVDGVRLGDSENESWSVRWRTGLVSYRSADLHRDAGSGEFKPAVAVQNRQITEAARKNGVAVHWPATDLLLRWPHVGFPVLLLLVIVLLLGGQTRLATRWATFWLLLTPLHIGMLRTLVQEAPWSPAARASPEPLPHRKQPDDRRLSGGPAFLVMLLTYVAVQLVLTGLDAIRF
jgi:hypothetical protein